MKSYFVMIVLNSLADEDLDKRYTSKYGESPVQNLNKVKEIGLKQFIDIEKAKWKCSKCAKLLCVHKEACLICGSKNEYFPHID